MSTIAQSYERTCDMEKPLIIAEDLVNAIAMIAETLGDEDDGGVVQRLAWLARDQIKEAEELRGKLFQLTHPRRDHFEREGWPSCASIQQAGGRHG